ncbi:MAG TPA: hypothetical protein VIH76_01010 [Candidatus Acidoferrales bacterium]
MKSSVEEILTNAVVEHLMYHDNDGMSLFVWSVQIGPTEYVYPISAQDADTALHMAEKLHEMREEWRLRYPFQQGNDLEQLE